IEGLVTAETHEFLFVLEVVFDGGGEAVEGAGEIVAGGGGGAGPAEFGGEGVNGGMRVVYRGHEDGVGLGPKSGHEGSVALFRIFGSSGCERFGVVGSVLVV